MKTSAALPLRLLLTTVLLLVAFASRLSAAEQTRQHQAWLGLTTQQLLAMADSNMGSADKDTALVCYAIVANRYHRGVSQTEAQQYLHANMQLWTIYYYDFYDYPKCFEHLSRAREIADEAGIRDANIFIGLGCMYQTISEETGNFDLGTKALDYYRQALRCAIDTGDDLHADMACTDVLSMASIQHGQQSVADEWARYSQLPQANRLLRRYNHLLHQAYELLEQNDYDGVIAIFDRQLSLISGSEYQRLIYFTSVEKAKVQAKKHDFIEAIASLTQAEQIADSLDHEDCQLEVSGLLADLHREAGNEAEWARYRERYIGLKDTLTNYRQLASAAEMEFSTELKQMDRRMTEMRHHREVMKVALVVAAVFSLVLLGVLLLLFRQNTKLQQRNRTLYQKSLEILRKEEAEVKYRGSHLADADKLQLYDRIADIMEHSDEIFSPDFSVERLAVLAGSKYKYVSQVINERCGQNFNTFLNQYRIKEACKRFSNQQQYGHLTIEAISQSVGFKSRSAFATSFKRNTGLTPSEYLNIAKKEHSASDF